MKFILLIASILIFSFASCAVFEAKKQLARTVAPEDLALELKFYASCQEFKDRILPSVWISKHDLCLPIQFNVSQNPDVDDLKTHYFCTNLEHGRSIVHFVEIYESDETIQYPSFVLSLVPTAPFRVLTKRTLVSRRPNCFITNDYCNATNAIVNSCRTNAVVFKKEHIISHDRIYITANQQESRDCRTSVTECCAYIAPLTFGGICENVASTDLLKFPKKHHDNDHHDNKYDNDKHDNDHHDNDHHDNNHHDNDHHDNNHHDNDHHDNNHHDNDHHDNNHHDNDHGNWNGHGNGKPGNGKPGKPQHGKEEESKNENDQENDQEDK